MSTPQKMSTSECAVAVLAKAPHIGKVKTRMQPHLSDYQSCQLHMWCLQEISKHLLPKLTSNLPDLHTLLFVTDPHAIWHQFSVSTPPQIQYGSDLGAKKLPDGKMPKL